MKNVGEQIKIVWRMVHWGFVKSQVKRSHYHVGKIPAPGYTAIGPRTIFS